jgi:hypothetical protein
MVAAEADPAAVVVDGTDVAAAEVALDAINSPTLFIR